MSPAGRRAPLGGISRNARALLDTLVCRGEATADDLAESAETDPSDMSRATVYRLLGQLEQIQLVEHRHSGHGPLVYAPRGPTDVRLRCRSCGTETRAGAGICALVTSRLAAEFGFLLDASHQAFEGLCARCAPDG